jgi:CRISPR/Cas system-associated endonuclease Cas3-HD
VLHGLPSYIYPAKDLLAGIQKTDIPVWFIYQQGMNFNTLFNDPSWGISSKDLGVNSKKINQISAELNQKFNLFQIENEMTQSISQFPPLNAPFGELKFDAKPEIILYQKIGKITTSQPVFSIHQIKERKIGLTLAEGIWRWRIQAYTQQNSHENFTQFITKFAGALSLKEDKNPFQINFEKKFYENYRLQISAQVLNTLRETIPDAEIKITIQDTGKNIFPYQMNFNGKNYTLDAGYFNPGKYKLLATAKTGEKNYQKQFFFDVLPLDLENIKQNTNATMLNNLSAKHKGKMLYGIHVEDWIKLIENENPPKSVLIEQETMSELISISILGIVLLLLMSTEWLIRKYYGSY